jgi:catalase
MATTKKTIGSKRSPSRTKTGDISAKGVLRTNDVLAKQAQAADKVAAAIPFNATKKLEYGHEHAMGSRAGATVDVSQVLTTNQGVPIADNQSSLKAGLRGPTLLEDFILREKITHFDHERIPERIVHARGSGAHGYFEAYHALT